MKSIESTAEKLSIEQRRLAAIVWAKREIERLEELVCLLKGEIMACVDFECRECGYAWANNGARFQDCPLCGDRTRGNWDETEDDGKPTEEDEPVKIGGIPVVWNPPWTNENDSNEDPIENDEDNAAE